MNNLIFPVFILGSLIGTLIGAFVHLLAGGKLIRLVFCVVFGWIGFWGGNYFSQRFNLPFFHFFQINYGSSVIISFLSSLIGYWISGENKPEGDV